MDLSSIKLPGNLSETLFKTYHFNLPGGLSFEPSLLMAVLMVFLVFLLILTLGSLRHRYTNWAFKGIVPGIAFGFAIALIIEGIMLVGGRTILTEALGWKSAPKPISNALDAGRSKLVNVLGVTQEVPESHAQGEVTAEEIMYTYTNMSEPDQQILRSFICTPE